MILPRLIDLRGQIILGIVSLLSFPVLWFYGFVFGLLFLGGWQLLSAGLNTASFIRNGHKKQIIAYWKWTAIIFSFIFFSLPFSTWVQAGSGLFIGLSIFFGWLATEIYYMMIYNDLIVHLKLRNELSGLLKS
jgi:hypothetical protein